MKKKVLESGRRKKVKNVNLEQLCTILNQLHDSSYPGPYSVTDAGDPRYDVNFIVAEREAWELAREILDPLRMVTRSALKHPANLHTAYSRLTMRFHALLGRYATGKLMVDIKIDNPHDHDSPIRLMATVDSPQAYGAENMKQVIAVTLWKRVFLEEGYKKLRQCLHCPKWFVDNGRNKIAKFCDPSCTNIWWNRSKRRLAMQRNSSNPKYKKRRSSKVEGKRHYVSSNSQKR